MAIKINAPKAGQFITSPMHDKPVTVCAAQDGDPGCRVGAARCLWLTNDGIGLSKECLSHQCNDGSLIWLDSTGYAIALLTRNTQS